MELEAWDCGARDGLVISGMWCERLHAEKVASKVTDLLEKWMEVTSGLPLEKVARSR